MELKCPNCSETFEYAVAGREKDKYGFAQKTLGSEIATMAVENNMKSEEIKQTLFKREHNMHEGRVNQTLYLLRKRGFLKKVSKQNVQG